MNRTDQATDQPLAMLFDCEHCGGVHEGTSSHADQFSGEWLYEVTCPEDGLTEWLVGSRLGRPLPAHDGVDADAARRLISTHMLVPGQIWESKNYGTDHTVTEHVGDDLWEITGPVGNVYVTTPQTFRALNRLTGRTQVR